jgi:PD-(D/E)XK nuclease superfamily protein
MRITPLGWAREMGLPSPPPSSRHPVDVGVQTEAIILAELARRGYRVLLPFGHNQRYDLVLEIDGSFLRVQCKTGRLRDGCVIFRAQSVRSNTRKAVMRDYKDDVELFIIHCPDTRRLYVIPIEDATRTQGTLRIDPTDNGQNKRVRWARDYELPA